MNDSQLLNTGYEALHEAHLAAGMVIREIHEAQEIGAAVHGAAHQAQFTAMEDRLQTALCAFRELENRAAVAGRPNPDE